MTATNMRRRAFLKGLAASGLVLASQPILLGCSNAFSQRFISAASSHSGEHYVVAFDDAGRLLNKVKIDNRGHDFVMLAHNRVAAFSRRPFTKLFIIDLDSNTLESTINAEQGYHFYGHGVFDKQQQWLVTTENHIETSQGFLVVRDVNTFEVIKRLKSGGIGPHQCALVPNSDLIVVANGGIKTHPKSGRDKLNLASMKPNLSYIDLLSGQLVDQVTPTHHQLSLRHLAVSNRGEVIVGAQYQGHYRDVHPLVFSHKLKGDLTPLLGDKGFWQEFDHYIASVAISNNTIAVTSPRGNKVAYWQLDNHQFVAQQRLADCAGIAPYSEGLLITNGKGQIVDPQSEAPYLAQLPSLKFDNHLISV
jgi:hypothetical protein